MLEFSDAPYRFGSGERGNGRRPLFLAPRFRDYNAALHPASRRRSCASVINFIHGSGCAGSPTRWGCAARRRTSAVILTAVDRRSFCPAKTHPASTLTGRKALKRFGWFRMSEAGSHLIALHCRAVIHPSASPPEQRHQPKEGHHTGGRLRYAFNDKRPVVQNHLVTGRNVRNEEGPFAVCIESVE